MKIKLPEGIEIECTTQELLELMGEKEAQKTIVNAAYGKVQSLKQELEEHSAAKMVKNLIRLKKSTKNHKLEWTQEEDQILLDNLGKKRKQLRKLLPRRSLNSISWRKCVLKRETKKNTETYINQRRDDYSKNRERMLWINAKAKRLQERTGAKYNLCKGYAALEWKNRRKKNLI